MDRNLSSSPNRPRNILITSDFLERCGESPFAFSNHPRAAGGGARVPSGGMVRRNRITPAGLLAAWGESIRRNNPSWHVENISRTTGCKQYYNAPDVRLCVF